MQVSALWPLALLLLGGACAAAADFDAKKLGAVGDGRTKDTAALQKTIDVACAAGGGTVLLTPGAYLCGTLELKSGVTLQLQKGATLLGSTDPKDYRHNALLVADKQHQLGLCGEGCIDGQGAQLYAAIEKDGAWRKLSEKRPSENVRPMLIKFTGCADVTLRDITLRSAACWVQDYIDCERLTLEHVTVRSTAAWNNDGIDIYGCRDVVVRGCDVDSADDGICLKSGDAACDRVLIENCRVRSSASALKFGTGSHVGFKNITVRNLEVYDTARSAIALESVDGAIIENVDIAHVRATNTGNAIFLRLGHRDAKSPVGALRNVLISDVTVEVPADQPDLKYPFPCPPVRVAHNLIPSSIVGLPGHPVQNVTLRDITISYAGGGRRARAQVPFDRVPEQAGRYPEFSMFGELPAWGFYCRHAEGISFSNCTFRCAAHDFRSALVCDDVNKLQLDACRLLPAGDEPVVLLNAVHEAILRACQPPAGAQPFLETRGGCAHITTQP